MFVVTEIDVLSEENEAYPTGHQEDKETKGVAAEEDQQKGQGAGDAQEAQKRAVL